MIGQSPTGRPFGAPAPAGLLFFTLLCGPCPAEPGGPWDSEQVRQWCQPVPDLGCKEAWQFGALCKQTMDISLSLEYFLKQCYKQTSEADVQKLMYKDSLESEQSKLRSSTIGCTSQANSSIFDDSSASGNLSVAWSDYSTTAVFPVRGICDSNECSVRCRQEHRSGSIRSRLTFPSEAKSFVFTHNLVTSLTPSIQKPPEHDFLMLQCS